LAVAIIAISLPLALRKVPPNPLYGFRTRKTMSDPHTWYEANHLGGIALIVASVAALIGWALLMLLLDRSTAAVYSTFVCVAAIAMGAVVSLVQISKL
jgi:uncharacterized membrane protein